METTTHDRTATARITTADEAGVRVVEVDGELLHPDAGGFEAHVRDAVAGAPAVVVDLCGCGFMDSSAIRALLLGRRTATLREVPFEVACLPDSAPGQYLDRALSGLLAVHPDRATAVAAAHAAASG